MSDQTRTPAADHLYVSAITQKIHRSPTCSMTARNHAYNLDTSTPAAELAARGYSGCKRCGADLVLAAAAKVGVEGIPAPAEAPAPVNLWRADWPYPELSPAQFAALYRDAAEVIRARGYYEYEMQGYADEPGISVCGALKVAALEAEQAARPLDPAEARHAEAAAVTEELETRLSAVLYALGQLHTRTGIRDLSGQVAAWELGHYTTGPNPGRDKALALLEQAAALYAHLDATTAPVTEGPAV